ncbi:MULTISPECIES: hypothetical protein [Achromobacter]|jgi:hypothetical protein|uniref:Uncharacterized protein n=1 Tax=Achromobacter spanius TaxID=217203 RepID=A0AAW3HZG3_9BURK|nr:MULTISPECIES: hypothetical protein [Achromobacter]AZS78945.1 hypothetical protein ELS24_11095 [Achromobacter spanius]KNE25934.1 hypothetical protein AFM18_19670 [Achromobacter spanius]MCD0497013.1 hypothetical protein [Achromobacter sp. MY14]MCW3155770.1 hypothetical protein [Achromobacter spanius]
MLEKTINGFSVVAYATQPEGRTPPRAFLETRRLAPKAKAGDAAQDEAESEEPPQAPEGQPFEIFVSRRFRSTIEAMSAARNALDRVQSVDEDGVPDPLPE